MKKTYKLKPWVKTFLLLLPEIIIILQLFTICNLLDEIAEKEKQINIYTITTGGSKCQTMY